MPDPSAGFAPEKINFPTDRLTIGQMRRHDPGMFGKGALTDNPCYFIDGLAGLSFEVELAEQAFKQAMGDQPRPDPADRSEAMSVLNSLYKAYGLSTGMQQTRLLVREFEDAARRQASASRHR